MDFGILLVAVGFAIAALTIGSVGIVIGAGINKLTNRFFPPELQILSDVQL